MNTSILTVVLAGSLLAGQNGAQTWQNDYSSAQRQGIAQRKPLVVVFGSGANGWAKVIREATPDAEVSRVLKERYVCVYLDTATPTGQRLAQDFGISGSVGLVISDHACTSQAFWHQGDLSNASMLQYLQRFADPGVMLRGTETVNTSRTSFYPSMSQAPAPAFSSRSC